MPGFIRGLIVDEFDGHEPPPAVLTGLADYVRALEPTACPASSREPVAPRGLLDDARRALRAAEDSLAAGPDGRATAVLMIASARARLFLIDERYAAEPAAIARLRAADARLAALQAQVREGRPDAARGLARWRAASRDLEAALDARRAASLFDPAVLKAAANRRLPPKTS